MILKFPASINANISPVINAAIDVAAFFVRWRTLPVEASHDPPRLEIRIADLVGFVATGTSPRQQRSVAGATVPTPSRWPLFSRCRRIYARLFLEIRHGVHAPMVRRDRIARNQRTALTLPACFRGSTSMETGIALLVALAVGFGVGYGVRERKSRNRRRRYGLSRSVANEPTFG